MNKGINIALALLFLLSLSAFGQGLKTGWYHISEQATDFKRPLEKSSESYFINPAVIVSVEEFDDVKLVSSDKKPSNYYLQISFVESATAKWSAATKNALGSRLALIIDDKLVYAAMVKSEIGKAVSTLNSADYSKNELEAFLQQIKMEQNRGNNAISPPTIIKLPAPHTDGTVSLERTLIERRSRRKFLDKAISVDNLSQILWAAYGISYPIADRPFLRGGFHTAPSAGGLYPLDLYIIVGKVDGLTAGIYKYLPQGHALEKIADKDLRADIREKAGLQKMVGEAPLSIVYTAIFSRTTKKYGQQGRERYVFIDLGASSENLYLQVESLGLATCAIGYFRDEKLVEAMSLSEEEEPLLVMPIGHYEK